MAKVLIFQAGFEEDRPSNLFCAKASNFNLTANQKFCSSQQVMRAGPAVLYCHITLELPSEQKLEKSVRITHSLLLHLLLKAAITPTLIVRQAT